ncbi:hypothetical protein P692DRAFT_20872511 [Suillus brevipes Sb2]|nr:hypothetical protein P692DRAFT_20872511 [Suillus brevipes Sb2]
MEGRAILQERGHEVSDEDLQQQKDDPQDDLIDEGRIVLQGRGREVSDEDLQQQKLTKRCISTLETKILNEDPDDLIDEGRVVLEDGHSLILKQFYLTREAFDRVIATMAARSYSNSSILPERHLTGSFNW